MATKNLRYAKGDKPRKKTRVHPAEEAPPRKKKKSVQAERPEERRAEKRRPKKRKPILASYGPAHALGDFGRVRAVPGFRTAVAEMRPGMYLVTFVPAEAEEMGFLPFLAPAIANTAARIFNPGMPAPGAQPAPPPPGYAMQPVQPGYPAQPGYALPAPQAPAPHAAHRSGKKVHIPWMDAETAGDLGLGCDNCQCRRDR